MIIRLGIKLGLAGGTLYYLSEQGVWKDAAHSEELCKKMKTAVNPYVSQVKSKLPFEVPELPNSQKISYLTTHYWNKSVMWTFRQLADLPANVSKLTSTGFKSISDNTEIKKLFSSFSATKTDENVKETK